MIRALVVAHTSDEMLEVIHGRTTIRYNKTSDRVMTCIQGHDMYTGS